MCSLELSLFPCLSGRSSGSYAEGRSADGPRIVETAHPLAAQERLFASLQRCCGHVSLNSTTFSWLTFLPCSVLSYAIVPAQLRSHHSWLSSPAHACTVARSF